MRSLLAFFTAALALSAGGCDSTVHIVDAGPPVDGGGPSGELTIVGESPLTLGYGAEAEIAVRFTQEGAPARETVRFALQGDANDSTIDVLEVMTDADGVARTRVRAGTVSSAFRVRVSAPRSSPVFVNVSVGEGFGGLDVSAPYTGGRTQPTRRVIEVYAGSECDPEGGYPTFPSRSQTLPIEEETASWQALPAGLLYAIVARVEGPTGATLASGCEDEVALEAEARTHVDVVLVDAPLEAAGSYDVTLRIRTAVAVEAAILGALGPSAPEPEAAATLYLDAVGAHLRDSGDEPAANALALERADGVADGELAGELAALGMGPFAALQAFALELETQLSAMRVSGPLTIAAADEGRLGAVWSSVAFEVGPVGPDQPPSISLDLMALGIEPMPAIEVEAEGDDLALESLTLSVPLGRLMRALIEEEIAAADAPGDLLFGEAGCAALLDWVAAHEVGESCDADCAQSACVAVLTSVVAPFQEALRAVDAVRDRLTLSGLIELQDVDGDLRPDTLEGYELGGRWGSEQELGELLEASLLGDRQLDE